MSMEGNTGANNRDEVGERVLPKLRFKDAQRTSFEEFHRCVVTTGGRQGRVLKPELGAPTC